MYIILHGIRSVSMFSLDFLSHIFGWIFRKNSPKKNKSCPGRTRFFSAKSPRKSLNIVFKFYWPTLTLILAIQKQPPWTCSVRKGALRNFAKLTGKTCARVSFFKKRCLRHRRFTFTYRIPSGWLLLAILERQKVTSRNIKKLSHDSLSCPEITFYIHGDMISVVDNKTSAVYSNEQKLFFA